MPKVGLNLDSRFYRLDSIFWLDSTLKLIILIICDYIVMCMFSFRAASFNKFELRYLKKKSSLLVNNFTAFELPVLINVS